MTDEHWYNATGGCGDPSCMDCALEWGRKRGRDVTTKTKTVTIEGRTEFHSETGTEGGYWAVIANDSIHGPEALVDGKCPWNSQGLCPVETGQYHEHGRYEGLHLLQDGDHLVVYRSDGETVMWEGDIELIQHPLFSEDAHGFWIHADQAGEPRDVWSQLFFLELPCRLTREVEDK